MEPDNDKYKKVIEMLRRSGPLLDSGEEIEREVIRRILKARRPWFSEIGDFLFGWTYVGWVRRSLVFASVLLVVFFVFQQGRILKEINYLRNQTVTTGIQTGYTRTDELDRMFLLYRRGNFGLKKRNIVIPEKQLEELLDSINELNSRNKILEELLEKDPELKKIIEQKINESNHIQFNL